MSTTTKILKLFLITLFTVPAIMAVLLLALFAVLGGNLVITSGGGTVVMTPPILASDANNVLVSLGQLFVVLVVQFGWLYLVCYIAMCWLFATVSIFQKEILEVCRQISNTRIFLVIRKRRRTL